MEASSVGRPTFGGLATGLDTASLLDGLLALERIPLDRMQSRRAEISNQRGLMRDLNTKLLALREAAQNLDNRSSSGDSVAASEEFLRYAGSSSNEDVVTVTAGAGASPGDIEIEVLNLARGTRRFSESFSSSTDTALTSGQSITIALDNADPDAVPPIEATSIEVTAGAGGVSLQDLRDQINTSADNGGAVRADVLQVSDSDFQLVLTTTGTGLANTMTIGGDVAIQTPDPDNPTNLDNPIDATFEIFGQMITRPTNFVDDVLTGITLNLQSVAELDDAGENITETVTVEVDVEEVASSLEEFAKAYNDVMSFIDRQFEYNETTKQSGALSGDFTLRSIQSQLRDMVSSGYSFEVNPSNPFASGETGGAISGIGIEIRDGGRLSVDREKLEEALALDPLSVRQFLSGADRVTPHPDDEELMFDVGFAQRMASELELLVRSGDGTLAERDKGYAARLKTFDDSIARFERRIGQREETLIARFSELERIVAGLQGQQGFLTSIG